MLLKVLAGKWLVPSVSRSWTTVTTRWASSHSDNNVAFFGLGNMGQHMAANLVKKGYTVRGFDASEACMKSACGAGGLAAAGSLRECVAGAGVVVSALPNNAAVRGLYLGPEGVIANAEKGALLIDSSTVEPTVSQEVAAEAQKNGLSFIDAPMSGGVMGARDATLAFMVGGGEAELARAEPLLLAMGARHVHCGPVGAGEVAKIVNNLLMAVNMAGLAECMNLGERMGLNTEALLQVINGSSGRSWCSEVYCPVPGLLPNVPSTAGYRGGFKNDLLVKDLGLACTITNASGTATPLGALATQLYRLIQLKGHGEKDFSYLYQFIKANQ